MEDKQELIRKALKIKSCIL